MNSYTLPQHIELRSFQKRARDRIHDDAITCINNGDPGLFGLSAPTGAGKTLILSKAIKRISESLDGKCLFAWLTIGKGGLHHQSKSALDRHLNRSGINVSYLESALISGPEASINSVLIVDWEAINRRDAEGKPTNIMMREGEKTNVPDFFEEVRALHIPIVLIIDETHTHANTDRSKDLISKTIKPNYTIKTSACLDPDSWTDTFTVQYAEVARSGLLKNDIQCKTFDTYRLGTKLAVEKLIEVQKAASNKQVPFHPKLLVFVSDESQGSEEIDFVLDFLKTSYNWTEDNGKVVLWLSDYKTRGHEKCKENQSPINVIITKKAIDTGIDIPSINAILQFRSIKSPKVRVQSIGRGLRMPEQHHYNDAELDTLFYFVGNDAELDFTGADYLKDALGKNQTSIRSEFRDLSVKDFGLISSYFTRGHQNYLLTDSNLQSELFETLKSKIISGLDRFELKFGVEQVLSQFKLNLDKKIKEGEVEWKRLSESNDLELIYRRYTRKVIKQNYNKTISLIEDLVDDVVQSALNADLSIKEKQALIINNIEIFEQLWRESINELTAEVEAMKDAMEFPYDIPPTVNLLPLKGEDSYRKYLYQQHSEEAKGSRLQKAYADFMDANDNVLVWWNNCERQYKHSFGVNYIGVDGKRKTFFPDYFHLLKDGRLLISDPKENDIEEGNKLQGLVDACKNNDRIIPAIIKSEKGAHGEYFYARTGLETSKDLNEILRSSK